MKIKTSKINIINNPNKSFVQADFIEIGQDHIRKSGLLFFLIEIIQNDKTIEKIVLTIKQLLEKNYYYNEKILLVDQINSLKIESVFEAALVKTNRELLEFIDKEKINFNFKNLNIVVGLIYENQIHFSSIGQSKSFLIRKVNDNFNISDINPENDENELNELYSGKIFSSIISGELPEDSYTVFVNESLSQYLLNENFIKILDELKIEGATEQIKNLLKNINNYSNFCGLLIKNYQNNIENDDFKIPELDLSLTEKNTEKLLKTPGSINRKKTIQKIGNFLQKINIFKLLLIPIKFLKKIKNKKNKDSDKEAIAKLNKKSNKKKILSIIIVILLIGLFLSFYFKKNEDHKILEEQNVSNYEELINQKITQIESSLLYNNEDKAKEIINELNEVINSLADKEKKKIKNYSELEERIEEKINIIRKIIKISNPKEIANFLIINNQAEVSAISSLEKNNKIYAIDEKNNAIYSLKLDDGLLNKLIQDNNINGTNSLSTTYNNNIYFLDNDQIIILDQNEKISYFKINIENRNNISSFAIYNDRPYLLDREKKQIFKYNRSGSEFISSTPYIKENQNENPASLAINYHVFTLNNDGLISKYLSGDKISFSINSIDPPLKNPKILRIGNPEKKYLYILDREGKRIIVYLLDEESENAIFINQYYSDKFDNLKDFIIDEKNKKAYLLNGNIIFEIDLFL